MCLNWEVSSIEFIEINANATTAKTTIVKNSNRKENNIQYDTRETYMIWLKHTQQTIHITNYQN